MADTRASPADEPALDPREVSQLDEAGWIARAYRRGEPQLTLRAVVTGLLLGFLLSFANVYIGLKTGWFFSMALVACLVSFAVWRLLASTGLVRSPLSVLETNCMQTTASSAACATGNMVVGVFPAMLLLTVSPTAPRVVSSTGATRGLGWDMNTSFSTNRGDLFPLGSFGHTGFTGTSLWIDPASDMFVIFLSNRVHPDGKGDVGPLRGRVASIVAGSVTDTAVVDRAREQEARYYNEVVESEEKFASRNEGYGSTKVLTGIDVLERDNFKPLAGTSLGLITNHTGRDREGRQTIDVLNN